MQDGNNLVRVYSGTEISVTLLKEELEEKGIASLIQNDYQSGIAAGFYGGGTSAIDLFVQESDLQVAASIAKDFIENYNEK